MLEASRSTHSNYCTRLPANMGPDYNGLSLVWAGMCHAGKKQQLSGAQLKTKGWILKKKAQMRKKGYTSIPVDTKYTGRKRKKIV